MNRERQFYNFNIHVYYCSCYDDGNSVESGRHCWIFGTGWVAPPAPCMSMAIGTCCEHPNPTLVPECLTEIDAYKCCLRDRLMCTAWGLSTFTVNATVVPLHWLLLCLNAVPLMFVVVGDVGKFDRENPSLPQLVYLSALSTSVTILTHFLPLRILLVFTARAYARVVLGVVILSVRPSVRLSHAWIVTKLNDALQIFLYHTKG